MADASQGQKKGLGPLAWIAIGCAVVLLVVGVVLVAGGVFVASKAKDFVAEMEANPELTTARLLIKANPELEEVEADPEAGTITVRNTTTGEEVTVDYAELEKGKLSFSSGEKSFSVDAGDEGVNITSSEGEETLAISTGNQVTEEIPSWVPVWPDAEVADRSLMKHREGLNGSFTVQVSAEVAEVVEFYRFELKEAGFDVSVSTYAGDGGDGGLVNGQLGGRMVRAIVGASDGATQVQVTYSETS